MAMGEQVTDELYAAILSRDLRYDGRIYIGIRSTRIVCFPSCHSRIPKRENVLTFTSVAAVRAGFRPCKRCRPDEPGERSPDGLVAAQALAIMRAALPMGVSVLEASQQLHLSASQLERTVTRVWGRSWHQQYDVEWVNAVKAALEQPGATISGVAHGFRISARYFGRRFRRLTGRTPSQHIRDREVNGFENLAD